MKESTDNIEILLAQWQTCVEMANSVSQRRDTMNNIFVTLNLAIIATVTVLWDLKAIWILIVGVILCILWILLIRNFSQLNREKFNVINALEKKLQSEPFNDEWLLLKKNKKYINGTKLEALLPIVFMVLYAVAIYAIANNMIGGTT